MRPGASGLRAHHTPKGPPSGGGPGGWAMNGWAAPAGSSSGHSGTCSGPGGPACCYWNGYGTQCDHPAQGLTGSEHASSASLGWQSTHTFSSDVDLRRRPLSRVDQRDAIENGYSTRSDGRGPGPKLTPEVGARLEQPPRRAVAVGPPGALRCLCGVLHMIESGSGVVTLPSRLRMR